jgi:hypothetical protein
MKVRIRRKLFWWKEKIKKRKMGKNKAIAFGILERKRQGS